MSDEMKEAEEELKTMCSAWTQIKSLASEFRIPLDAMSWQFSKLYIDMVEEDQSVTIDKVLTAMRYELNFSRKEWEKMNTQAKKMGVGLDFVFATRLFTYKMIKSDDLNEKRTGE